jgi:hypothetical protein
VRSSDFAAEQTAGDPRCRGLIYEELCAAPQTVTQQLFDFAGLDWNAQTQAFLQVSTSRARDDYYSVFKDPLASAWRWQDELPAADVAKVAAIARQSTVAAPYFAPSAWNRCESVAFAPNATPAAS